MVRAKKYVVKKYFKGMPKKNDFELVEYDLPPLEDGEVLVKAEWISVDPYLRAYNASYPIPYDQFSYQVAVVQESKDPQVPVGTKVVSHKGWRDYSILNFNNMPTARKDQFYKLPDMQGLSESFGVGAVGMPGVTAYYGFLNMCKPQPGETVVVTGAAGAVGSIVGQIAKIKGCRVIGFAGSDLKAQWLEKDLGFDKVFNYKKVDISKALKEGAPNGVDCYFDNVGGEISSIIINQMKVGGRVAVCGSISSYNDSFQTMPKATILQPALVFKQLEMKGLHSLMWNLDEWHQAMKQMIVWIKSGQIKVQEHITEGFDNLFDAFIGMLDGENFGKAVVKV